MGKLYKKLSEKPKKSVKKIISSKKRITNEKPKVNFNCVVKLDRIDISKYMQENGKKGEENRSEKVFSVGIKIRKGTFSVEKKSIKLGNANTINIGLSFNSNEAIVQHCSVDRPIKYDSAKTLNQLIDLSWRKCKAENKNYKFKEGEIVLAKMRGWTPWPCVIEKFTANRKSVRVFFFGTGQTGSVELKESVSMEKSTDVIRLLLLRSLDFFRRGICEAEKVLGIDEKNSLTREHAQIDN